ncbi:recombinase family protein [Streptomyces sp. CA-106110]|uniref:recombinase family protein n=1 Tax=Streptomyces sp. CA-106110 TaxID=3240044 RepID=UPI003D93CC2B
MIRLAFAGRCSTEDLQDPEASRNRQLTRARALIEPAEGQIVTEYFDIGHSRSLPWQRRPRANALLQALRDPNRGFDAVVISEPQRTFYGNQFGNTFPVFVHFRIPLRVPEVGGPIDPDNEAHDLVMSIFGGMSKGERNRIKIRVRTAMSSQAQLQGRYLGGRPPYGYWIVDTGPHPNPAKAAAGQGIHKLQPDPAAAPVVQRLFTMYVDGMSDKAIATQLTRDGIPCPSAHDTARTPHRKKAARQAGAVRAILINPRYTGYEVWNKQRKEERLLDIDDVTLGHRTHMTHNPTDQWVWSNEPAHDAIVTTKLFEAVQTIRRQRARAHQRQERPGRQGGQRAYALRGRVRCLLCGRKMQPAATRNRVYYRCELKEQEAALHPGPDHPRTVNLREDVVCRALDSWVARAFAPDRLTAALTALSHASTAASTSQTQTPEQAQARHTIKECERRLARYQAALEAGADPAVVTQWINEAQRDKEAAQRKLDALPAATRTREPQLTVEQIGAITERLGNIAQRIEVVDADKKGPLYEALGITISYEHATRTATVRSRPSSPYRQWLWLWVVHEIP